jgi:hypothetical protein
MRLEGAQTPYFEPKLIGKTCICSARFILVRSVSSRCPAAARAVNAAVGRPCNPLTCSA